jgi:hypothetical protein
MQGPPFMEVLLHAPLKPNDCWTLRSDFSPLFEREPFQLAPRIELWLDPRRITKDRDQNSAVGYLMLGAWGDQFKATMRTKERYRSMFKRSGQRNFHREILRVRDLPFESLSNRLRTILALLFNRAA